MVNLNYVWGGGGGIVRIVIKFNYVEGGVSSEL